MAGLSCRLRSARHVGTTAVEIDLAIAMGRLNPTLMAVLFVFALSASAAIFLILEMGQPFAGLMQISSAPLRSALVLLRP